jgi:hypothetical protein
VVESFLKSKKYIVPSAIASPIFAGCVAAVYVGTGAGHFDPAKNALVFSAGREPEKALSRADRRAYQKALQSFLAETHPEKSPHEVEKTWARLQSRSTTGLNERGQPTLNMQVDEQQVSVGASAGNILSGDAPPRLAQQLLEARLQMQLQRKAQRFTTESDIIRDWRLLQQAMAAGESDAQLSGRPTYRVLEPTSLLERSRNNP